VLTGDFNCFADGSSRSRHLADVQRLADLGIVRRSGVRRNALLALSTRTTVPLRLHLHPQALAFSLERVTIRTFERGDGSHLSDHVAIIVDLDVDTL
jgi:hypothetical protein